MNLENMIEGLKEKAAKLDPIDTSIKFNVGGSIFHVDGTKGTNEVTTENKEAECTISISQEDFIALSKGELNPMMAVMGGKIKIDGDMMAAMKLKDLF